MLLFNYVLVLKKKQAIKGLSFDNLCEHVIYMNLTFFLLSFKEL